MGLGEKALGQPPADLFPFSQRALVGKRPQAGKRTQDRLVMSAVGVVTKTGGPCPKGSQTRWSQDPLPILFMIEEAKELLCM